MSYGQIARQPGRLGRRDFLKASVAVAAIAFLDGCSVRPVADTPWPLARPWSPVTFPVDDSMLLREIRPVRGTTVKVLAHNEHISPDVISGAFPQQTGIQVDVIAFDTLQHAIDKVANANLDADVLIGVTKDRLSEMVAGGLLRPLNHDLIPNLSNLWPTFSTAAGSFWDVGMRYSLPYSVWSMGVAYAPSSGGQGPAASVRVDPSDPYGAFWDGAQSGRVSLLDDYRQVVTLALLRDGVRGTRGLNTDVGSTRAALLSQASSALVGLANTTSPVYSEQPLVGTTRISQAYSSDMLSASRALAGGAGPDAPPIGFLLPKGGREVGGDHMVVLQAGRNPDAALTLVNWLLDRDNALLNYTWTGAQPPLSVIRYPDQIVKGSYAALSGRYGSYGMLPPELSSTVLTEEIYSRGWFGALELAPGVQTQWADAAPASLRP